MGKDTRKGKGARNSRRRWAGGQRTLEILEAGGQGHSKFSKKVHGQGNLKFSKKVGIRPLELLEEGWQAWTVEILDEGGQGHLNSGSGWARTFEILEEGGQLRTFEILEEGGQGL